MSLEDNLRDRLEAVPAPPTRIDVESLVDAGRRRAFRRRAAEAAGGVAVVAAVLLAVPVALNAAGADPVSPPPVAEGSTDPTTARTDTATAGPTKPGPSPTTASPSPTSTPSPLVCVMEELPVPNGVRQLEPKAVDPTGRYIVGNHTVGQNFRAVLWTDGRPRALPVDGDSVQATAVNSSGVVVGLLVEENKDFVFRYEGGKLSRLRTPEGDWNLYPEPAINSAGDIVVNAKRRSDNGEKMVLLWKAGSSDPVKLPLPADAIVHDINDDGTLVGGIYPDGTGQDAYAWTQTGDGRKLERSARADGATGYAVAGDWATGGVWRNGQPRTVVWNIRTGAVTELATGSPGIAVNSLGWAVMQRGYLVRAGADIGLDVPSGQFGRAMDVADNGLVVGFTLDQKRDSAYVGPRVWRC